MRFVNKKINKILNFIFISLFYADNRKIEGVFMQEFESSCCFTGYRPEKFDFPFDENFEEYRVFMSRLATSVADMIEKGCTTFYTGMAMGFDIIAAEHVALVKKLNRNIRLIAVIPFAGQEKKWNAVWQSRYHEVLSQCDETVILSQSYTRGAYETRNRDMVDRSRYCITYYDGKQGGTGNTVRYALQHGRTVLNIFNTDPVAEKNSHYKPQLRLIPPDSI